jgi:sugar/nucleoside kinase (ribokinase family)
LTERAHKSPKILCSGIAVQDIVMRVESFPVPGTKVAGSEFIITGGGCAANASVTIARLKGRVAFAGPLGGGDDAVSNRILADLGNEGVDCSGVARVDRGTASVSLILLDAAGEKTIATRRGTNLGGALPKDAAGLVADVDAVLVDNRFPEFVTAVCRAAQKRKIPIVIDLDQTTTVDDPLLSLGTYVVSSAEALFGTTGLEDYGGALKKLAEHISGFLAITDERCLLARTRRTQASAGLQSESDRLARCRRCFPRRLYTCACRRPRASRRSAFCERHCRAQMHEIRRRLRRADACRS